MTDEARIARLTELAQRVWPDLLDVRVYADATHASVTFVYSPTTRAKGLSIEGHPRALDALEAALLVLAGDTPAWVEQLAGKWESDADACERAHPEWGGACLYVAKNLRQVAAELRERAKGKP